MPQLIDPYWILKILAQRVLRWLRRFGVLVLLACATDASASCPVPPLVGAAPALCAFERQLIECGCSEYIAWSESPGATSWHIIRQEVSADGTPGVEIEVGSLLATFKIWRDVDPDPWNETWKGRRRETPRVWFRSE